MSCRSVVQHVKEWYPEATLLAAGFSVGGNLLVNYLGEEGAATPLAAAASLCNPFNLVRHLYCVCSIHSRVFTLQPPSPLLSLSLALLQIELVGC